MPNEYTESDIQYIIENYGNISVKIIADKLGRTPSGIRQKAYRLGLSKEENLELIWDSSGLNARFEFEDYSSYVNSKEFTDPYTACFISGLVSAEGSFSSRISKGRFRAHFAVGMAKRDREVMDMLAEFFDKPESLYLKSEREEHQDTIRFRIGSIEDILKNIIPFFEQYPLQGKKRVQYEEWRDTLLEKYDLELGE